MPRLVIATHNIGKVREFAALLGTARSLAHLHLVSLNELSPSPIMPNETGVTFAENARIKALAIARECGLATLADDSGLCVDALSGRPGIESARWAGPDATDLDRNIKLLNELAGVPEELRTARFVCAIALAEPSGNVVVREGIWEGIITMTLRGGGGFGYDPLFFLPDFGLTAAEITSEIKNTVSHRARALAQLIPDLAALSLN